MILFTMQPVKRAMLTWYPPPPLDDFPIPLDFSLGQLSSHKPYITLVQARCSTLCKVHPPILKVIYFVSMI
jgi:hypothetical protein